MSGALEVIDRHVAHELGEVLKPQAPPQVAAEIDLVVAGFNVRRVRTDSEITAEAERLASESRTLRTQVERAIERRNSLRARLMEKGLTPLAIMSGKAWAKICEKHGLYRFERMGEDGKVLAETTGLTAMNAPLAGIVPVALFTFILGLAAILSGVVPFLSVEYVTTSVVVAYAAPLAVMFTKAKLPAKLWHYRFATLIATTLCGAFLAGSIESHNPEPINGAIVAASLIYGFLTLVPTLFAIAIAAMVKDVKVFRKLVHSATVLLMPKSILLAVLWPKKVDEEADRYSRSSKESVRVRFPEPPQSFVDTLVIMQKEKLTAQVAAAPEAVIVDRHGLMDGAMIDREIARIAAIRADPILYCSDGDMVAVLAQFGDFPNEEKLMTTLKEMGIHPLL